MMLNTTSMPATRPNSDACSAVGVDGSAVMATRPARAPFNAIVRSALPNLKWAASRAPIRPVAAAALVFRKTIATL